MAKRLILSIWAKSWLLAKSPSEQVLPGRRGQPTVAFGRLASLFQTIQYLGAATTEMVFALLYTLWYSQEMKPHKFLANTLTFARLSAASSFCLLW